MEKLVCQSIKRLNLTIASVTPCAGAQIAPATLADEANVRHNSFAEF